MLFLCSYQPTGIGFAFTMAVWVMLPSYTIIVSLFVVKTNFVHALFENDMIMGILLVEQMGY